MIADIQTQEVVAGSTDVQQHFVTVQDLELMYVGGGSVTGTFA